MESAGKTFMLELARKRDQNIDLAESLLYETVQLAPEYGSAMLAANAAATVAHVQDRILERLLKNN